MVNPPEPLYSETQRQLAHSLQPELPNSSIDPTLKY